MSRIPSDFQFSQQNLQDFTDCRRRFQLRYLEQVAWPAVEAEPLLEHEAHMQAGEAFHRVVQRYLLGVPVERLSAFVESSSDPKSSLPRWWGNFLAYAGVTPADNSLVESVLAARLGDYRLIGKFDLVRWQVDRSNLRVTIYDWKTSLKRPTHDWLADRLQTRIYPYLVMKVGPRYFGLEELAAEQVEMIYWFAEYPREPHRFSYSPEQYQADGDFLGELLVEISNLSADDFHRTPDESRCRFCTYRSLCDRGVKAGLYDPEAMDLDVEESYDISLDFDQIAEIEF